MFKKSFLIIVLISISVPFAAVYAATQPGYPPVEEAQGGPGYTVVIDAAHGGGEWGVNVRGLQEKDINLEVAKLVKKKIEAGARGIKVMLTRDDDEFISPQDRAARANAAKASCYVSIHCDYLENPSASGYAVYYFPGDGGRAQADAPVKLVKWADVAKLHSTRSMRLAGYLSQYLKAALIPEANSPTGSEDNDLLPVQSRGMKPAESFYLAGVDMPSAVIEMGNLNNKNDAEALKDPKTVNRMAYHIKEGIMNYFKEMEAEPSGGVR